MNHYDCYATATATTRRTNTINSTKLKKLDKSNKFEDDKMSKIANWSAEIPLGDGDGDDHQVFLNDEEFITQFIGSVRSAKLNVALNSLYEFDSRLKRCTLWLWLWLRC